MKTYFFLLHIIFFLFATGCHQTQSKLNLSFEDIENRMPKNWYTLDHQPGYLVSLDSVNVKSGKYAIAIEFMEGPIKGQVFRLKLPCNYDGKKITLSGYIKTENVTDGYAGLWMEINPGIAFDNMRQHGVTSTTDWNEHTITLDMYPSKTKEIFIGGLLVGKGKMWLDDLKITIDGKDIDKIQPYDSKPFPANEDREFEYGSNIVFPELNDQKMDDLELLGRIWGFLKYHHPEIAKGNYNWDYELFRILPSYLNANDHKQRNKILLKWINKYGRVPTKCKTCQSTDSAFIKPDLSWIENSMINPELNDLLKKIYLNRNQGNHYYIRMYPYFNHPIFSDERTYEAMDDPDTGFRLLALFRYWNMIQYFFPYKYLTDKDWSTVLKEYIPYFVEAKNRLEYELTVALLIGEICDSHAFLKTFKQIERLKGNGQAPVRVQFIEDKLVVMEYYNETTKDPELKKGDIITHIEGKPIETIVDSMKKYYSASNEAAMLRDVANNILRSNKHYININFVSSGKAEQKKINVNTWFNYTSNRGDTSRCYKFIDKDIGYITLKTIKSDDISVIKKEFINTKGIIIDIRNYPSANVIFDLGSYFMSNTTPYAKVTKGNSDNPGEFTFNPEIVVQKSEDTYQGKVVVIVNENTQSLAEFHAMVFRAGDNATIIGSQTAGANGNVSEINLPGGLKTTISGKGVYYPDGRETQRVGIVPDIEVKPTIKGIQEGHDELLEKAIEIIRRE